MFRTGEMHNLNSKRLLLLENALQLCNLGCWQWDAISERFFFTDNLFSIFDLPISTDRTVGIEEVNNVVHPSDSTAVNKKWDELRQGEKIDFYFKILTTSDEIRHLHFTGDMFEQPDGERITQGCCKDVTSEKQAINVLRDYADELDLQLKTYQKAEQAAGTATWQIDLNAHDAFYSDNYYRLHGIAPQSIPAHLNTFTGFIHPEDKEAVIFASDAAYRNKLPLHIEYRIIRQDGEIRYLRVLSEVTRGLTGEEYLTGIIQDGTEQKQLEIRLKNSNETLDIQNKHFRHTEQIASIGTWQVNLETRESYYSDNLYRLYGIKPQSVDVGVEAFIPFIYSEDQPKLKEAIRKAFDEHVLPDVNFRIVRQDGKLRYIRQTARILNNADGEQVMIGVMQDVTDQQLMAAQLEKLNKELSIQNETFTQAEQTASIGTWRWNLDTNDIFYSDNIYRIYGLKPQSVKPGYESFHRYFHPDDLPMLKQVPTLMQQTGVSHNVEYRIYRADGELRYIRGRNKLYTDAAGERIMIGTTQDVTDEVSLKQKIDEQLRFIKLLTNNLVDQIVVTNTSNTIVEFNKAAEKVQGVSRESVIGKNFFEAFPQSKVPQIIDILKRALKGEMIKESYITSPLNKGYIERYHIPVKDENDQVVGVLTLVRDVTEEFTLRKQLENRLQFIESMVDSSLTRIIALDKDLNYTLWNKQCEQKYGLKTEQVLGKNILEFYPSLKKEAFYDDLRTCLHGDIVYIAPKETEKEGYHESHLVPLKDIHGDVTGLLWLIHDLTERREAEKRIEESQKLLQQTAEASPDAITIFDLENEEPVYINNRLAEWIDIPSDRLESMGIEGRLLLIHPEDRERLLAFNRSMQKSNDDEINTIEYRILNRHKRYLWIRNRTKVFQRDKKGKVTHIISVLQDITQNKQVEQQLHEEHRRLKEAQAIGHIGSFEWNANADMIYWSEEMFRIHGLDPDNTGNITLEKVLTFIHPDDLEYTASEYSKCRRQARNINITHRIIRADGEIRFLERSMQSFADNKGKVTHISGTVQDITERKKVEEQILQLKDAIAQKANDKYQRLFSSIDEGFCIIEMLYNKKGEPVDWYFHEVNEAFIKQNHADMTGKKFSEYVPSMQEFEYWLQFYDNVLKSGKAARTENYVAVYDEWRDIYASPLHENENLLAVVFDDITERKHEEQRKAFLLKLSDALRPLADPIASQKAAVEMLATHLNVDRSYYAEFDWPKDVLYIHYEYTRVGAMSAIGAHPISAFNDLLVHSHKGDPLVCNDIMTHPVFGREAAAYKERGTDAFILMPLVKEGTMVACICVTMETPRTWSSTEIELIKETAERTWAAVERAKAVKAMQQSEERYRSLVEASESIVWILDGEGRAASEMPRWGDFTGMTFEEYKDFGYANATHPDDHALVMEKWMRAITEQKPLEHDFRLRYHDGGYRRVFVRAVPVQGDDGKVHEWVGTITDIQDKYES